MFDIMKGKLSGFHYAVIKNNGLYNVYGIGNYSNKGISEVPKDLYPVRSNISLGSEWKSNITGGVYTFHHLQVPFDSNCITLMNSVNQKIHLTLEVFMRSFNEVKPSNPIFIDNVKLGEASSVSIDWSKNPCIHQWQEYRGFTENYEYCTKCDKKRE